MPELAELLKRSRAEAVAVLSRFQGDIFEAEDAVSEAVLQALETWPVQGTPRNPNFGPSRMQPRSGRRM